MDLLTQGLLGAAMAQTAARREETGRATVIGFLSGLLADADVLIQSSTDPLFMLEYHRHFSHSLFFIPIGALLAAVLLWPFFKSAMRFGRLYVFALLGYSLSGFIDTCTSYGTYLLWPLLDERISLHIIAIIDPLFTLGLLLAVALGLTRPGNRAAQFGLMYCSLYLIFGWWQHARVDDIARQLASSRGHTIDRIIVKPTMGNLVLWRSTYIDGQRIYVDAIRLGIFAQDRVYEGDSVDLFIPEQELKNIPGNSVLYQDVLRFSALVEGYLARHRQNEELIGDLRYSLLPNSIEPLWAIAMRQDEPARHVEYLFFRNTDAGLRQRFMHMLLGRADIVK